MPEQDNIVDAPECPEDDTPGVFDVFETDRNAEEEGKWFDVFGDRGDGEIKLRGFASKASINCRRRLEAKYRRNMKTDGNYPQEITQRMIEEQLAEAIIMDWRGKSWKTKEGPLKFSPDAALMILKRAPHLRNKISVLAGDMDAFRTADQEAAIKN